MKQDKMSDTIKKASENIGKLAEKFHNEAVAAGFEEAEVVARNLCVFAKIAQSPGLLKLFADESVN